MKTIKQKILVPLLLVVIIIPLLTLIIFNIAIRIYTDKNVKQDLANTLSFIDNSIRNQITIDLERNSNEIGIQNAINKIKTVKKISQLTGDINIYLLNKDGRLLYPKASTNIEISSILKTNFKNDKIVKIKSSGSSFYVAKSRITNFDNSPYILFVSNLDVADGLIYFINSMLLLIMLLGIIISIIIITSISNSVSTKINELCYFAARIGDGEFETIKNNNDIKEFSQLVNSFNEMSFKMKIYDTAQKTFLQNASHEIRTPLMSIGGYAEGIENGVLTDYKKAATIIKNESNKLTNLINELLTLSRIENNNYERCLENINLAEILKEYMIGLKGLAIKENKSISLELENEAIVVFAEESLLNRVITNIVGNCIRYANSKININVTSQNNKVKIRISDDGNGIDEQDLAHIFDRFYKGKSGNFGLGLSIAKVAVEYMGGSIVAFNNNGAVFEITLNSK